MPWSHPGPGLGPRGQELAITQSWCQRFLETWFVAFQAGAPRAHCGSEILQHTKHTLLRPGLGALSPANHMVSLLKGHSSPELEHFQGFN